MFRRRINDELELSLPEEHEAEEGFALIRENLAHLGEWLPWAGEEFSLEDARAFITRNRRQFAEGKGFALRMVYRGRMAGNVGYNAIDRENRRTELGYWLGSSFQGRGLVTASCRALIDHAFGAMGLNRVEVRCAAGNRRSRMVAGRLGLRQEAVLRQAEWAHDRFNDLVVYAALACEWPRVG